MKLVDITEDDIKIRENQEVAVVTLKCDEVLDPVADNIPRGVADLEKVEVFVDGSEAAAETADVKAEDGGDASFWKQHPYKGSFKNIKVEIPLVEGTHSIQVKTSENAAGLTGFDDLDITFFKEVKSDSFSGTFKCEIDMPAAPAPGVADSITYSVRPPPGGASATFTENVGEEDSLIFHGDINADGEPDDITVTEFNGLTDEKDKFTAEVPLIVLGQVVYRTMEFTETNKKSNKFKADYTFSGGVTKEEWKIDKIANKNGSGIGTYAPATIRSKGFTDPQNYSFEYLDVDFECEQNNGWYYVKGGSINIILFIHDPQNPETCNQFTYSVKDRKTLKKLMDGDIVAHIKSKGKKVSTVKDKSLIFKLLSNTDNHLDRDNNGWPDESDFDADDEERKLQLAGNALLLAQSDEFNEEIASQQGKIFLEGSSRQKPKKIRFTFDDGDIEISRDTAGAGIIIPGEWIDLPTATPQTIPLHLKGLRPTDTQKEIIADFRVLGKDNKTYFLIRDSLNYVVQKPIRAYIALGSERENDPQGLDPLKAVIEYLDNDLRPIFDKIPGNKGVAPAGRYDVVITKSFTNEKINDAIQNRRHPLTNRFDCLDYLFIIAHATWPIFGKPGSASPMDKQEGKTYIQTFVEPYLTPDEWKEYEEQINVLRRMGTKITFTADDVQDWQTAIRTINSSIPRENKGEGKVLDLRMQSYVIWKTENGSVALHPSQMFPENYTPSDKLKIYHFTCNNYWSGGIPEIWKAKNGRHYSRAGYDVFGGLSGNKLPYVIENGWGNPAPQNLNHFNTFMKPFLENDILKRNRNHR